MEIKSLFNANTLYFALIFRTVLLAWWFSNFTPWQQFLKSKVKPKIPVKLNYLSTALSCFVCQSFWFTLLFGAIFYHEFVIFDAIFASIVAYTYDKLMNSLRQYF